MIEIVNALRSRGYGVDELYSLRDWQDFRESGEFRSRRELEDHIGLGNRLPIHGAGWCGVCQGWSTLELSARHSGVDSAGALQLAYSETAVCISCRTNSRMRAAADMLAAIEPSVPAGITYITEQKTNLFRALSKMRPSLVGSEFLPDVPTGTTHPDGTRCEDLTALSFASGSMGVLLSLDVLEHVADPSLALREIGRVLVPGGYAVLTFPFFPSLAESRRRAVLADDGVVKHLMPPVYHGNPINSGGALVFNDFGWDFVEEASGLFANRLFFFYQSFIGWHFGASRFAMILKA